MNINMKDINEDMLRCFHGEIDKCFMCVESVDEESTNIIIFVQLYNGIMKQIEYQYDNDNPDSYGYNIEEFDPFVFEHFFKISVDKF